MTIPQPDLEASLKKTVLLYNRLRSPEAVAKIVQVTPEIVVISLSGSFCYDCGDVQKYVDDFAKDFKVFIDYAELTDAKTRETSPRSVEVSYMVKTR
jgi:hypothetical protein